MYTPVLHSVALTPGAARYALAMALRLASHALSRLARALAPRQPLTRAEVPRLEFHAEAGAPEGALYVDGRLVGHLEGVSRL